MASNNMELGLMDSGLNIPLKWYFDAAVLAQEEQCLFDLGPRYVGHKQVVPNVGDYFAVPWKDEGQVLVNNGKDISLLSNICRHRQAIMLRGRGHTQQIVCPLHRWTYHLDGQMAGAPYFDQNPCLNLERFPLTEWNGLLFQGQSPVMDELTRSPSGELLDFRGYHLDSIKTARHNFNWKTFIEVYLEDYHVNTFHPGLSEFVDCSDLRWEMGTGYSVQTVGLKNKLNRSGSPVYERWQQVLKEYNRGLLPEYGAIWMVIFPNIMVEWYPHVRVISTVWPDGPERCTNVMEFYYPEDIALFERDFVMAQQQAYSETAVEDDDICVRMSEGRQSLWERGKQERGPYQTPMEDGLLHFHEYLSRHMTQGR